MPDWHKVCCVLISYAFPCNSQVFWEYVDDFSFLDFFFVFCCHKYLWIVFSAWRFYIVRLKTMYTVAYIQLDRSQKVIAIAFGFVSFWWYWKWLFMWRGEEIITLKALSRRQLVLPSYITLAIGQDPRGAPFLPEDWCPRTGSLLVRLGRGSSTVRSLNAAPRWSSDVLTLFGFAPVWKARQRKRRTRFSRMAVGASAGLRVWDERSRDALARGLGLGGPRARRDWCSAFSEVSPAAPHLHNFPPPTILEAGDWQMVLVLSSACSASPQSCSCRGEVESTIFIFCLRLFVYCLFNATVLHFHI